MDPSLAASLERLPKLDIKNRFADAPACKLCGDPSPFFDVVDYNKFASKINPYAFGAAGIGVPYHQCPSCGFVFTRFFDDWSSEAFSKFIYNDDYIKVDGDYVTLRPLRSAERIGEILRGCETARILDYGSGSGAFGARLRELGFHHVESYDPFSSPGRPDGHFDIITCSEVMEHTPDPPALIADVRLFLAKDGCFIFSQTLQPADIGTMRGSWWYMAPRNGHVSLYTANALSVLAAAHGLILHSSRAGRLAFSSAAPGAFARIALSQFGPPFVFVRLYAPDPLDDPPVRPTGAAGMWHAVEVSSSRARFRWTATQRLVWPMPPVPAGTDLHVEIPFINAIDGTYAEGMKAKYGSAEVRTKLRGQNIVADFKNRDETSDKLTILAPPPKSPAELRGARDKRPLGLAIPLRASPAAGLTDAPGR